MLEVHLAMSQRTLCRCLRKTLPTLILIRVDELGFWRAQGPGLKVDRPRGRESYVCEHPGGYKLEQGRLFPFPLAMSAPIMVVSPALAA